MSDLGNKKIMSENIQRYMDKYGYKISDLARATGQPYTTVSDWVKGKYYPRIDKVEILANLFGVEKKDLVEKYVPFETLSMKDIPIYSCISCGSGLWIDEQPEDYVGIPSYMQLPNASYFANPAEGDSMEPLIQNGDCLVFERKDQVESGKVGSFSLNGKYYCKRFRTYPDGSAWLYSDNQSYQPILIRPEDDFRVLGELKLKVSKI